jgi:glycosyltransferase involved in cell wall biosynthesis
MLEAMAAGLPIVATRHGGIPEAMDHERDGLLVAEKSPAELSAALLRLCEEPDLLQSCSRRARETVSDRYGLERQIARMEECYAEALGSP